jgi:hypothetical protein
MGTAIPMLIRPHDVEALRCHRLQARPSDTSVGWASGFGRTRSMEFAILDKPVGPRSGDIRPVRREILDFYNFFHLPPSLRNNISFIFATAFKSPFSV